MASVLVSARGSVCRRKRSSLFCQSINDEGKTLSKSDASLNFMLYWLVASVLASVP